jgi:hypothetical protein
MPPGIEGMLVRLMSGARMAAASSLSGLGVELTLEEIHKGSRLGCCGAAGRKHGPQVERGETPFHQNGTDGARSQLRAEHPFRRDGKSCIGEHRGPHAFRSDHPQPCPARSACIWRHGARSASSPSFFPSAAPRRCPPGRGQSVGRPGRPPAPDPDFAPGISATSEMRRIRAKVTAAQIRSRPLRPLPAPRAASSASAASSSARLARSR